MVAGIEMQDATAKKLRPPSDIETLPDLGKAWAKPRQQQRSE